MHPSDVRARDVLSREVWGTLIVVYEMVGGVALIEKKFGYGDGFAGAPFGQLSLLSPTTEP